MRQEIEESAMSSDGMDVPGCVALIFSTNRGFLEHYRSMFKSLSFKPITASTPEATVALLRLLVAALVIVDKESGTQESHQILRCSRDMQNHAPVLMIGQRSDPSFRHQALALGAAGYLDHPAHSDDIIHVLFPGHARAHRTVHRSH